MHNILKKNNCSWYIFEDKLIIGKLEKENEIHSKNKPLVFENEDEWKQKCDELGISVVDHYKDDLIDFIRENIGDLKYEWFESKIPDIIQNNNPSEYETVLLGLINNPPDEYYEYDNLDDILDI